MSAESLQETEHRGTAYFTAAGREEAAQTARLLLCYILEMGFTDRILVRERGLSAEAARRYATMLEQRAEDVPLQYLIKVQSFCGLELYVDERVLIPYYGTECLVETVLWDRREGHSLDLCTESGCTPLVLLKLGGFHSAFGVDISADTLAVAEINRARTGPSLSLRRSDLFPEVPEYFSVVAANPPYIESTEIETLSVEMRDHEPWLALDGTVNGPAFYQRFAVESDAHLTDGDGLYLEIGAPQGATATVLLRAVAFLNI